MSQLSSKGFSLVETLVASALVAIWAVSSQQAASDWVGCY